MPAWARAVFGQGQEFMDQQLAFNKAMSQTLQLQQQQQQQQHQRQQSLALGNESVSAGFREMHLENEIREAAHDDFVDNLKDLIEEELAEDDNSEALWQWDSSSTWQQNVTTAFDRVRKVTDNKARTRKQESAKQEIQHKKRRLSSGSELIAVCFSY